MRRTTPEDEAFMKRVAQEFRRACDQAIKTGLCESIEEFARALGITRAALYKHFNQQSMPSLRVLQRAKKYGVRLSYGDLGNRYLTSSKEDPRQTRFPFTLEDVSKEQVYVKKFSPKNDGALELLIQIDRKKTG